MRIRRKKNLSTRLNNVSDLLIKTETVANVNLAVADKEYIDCKAIFNNDNPLSMEIGCGKGGFIIQKAQQCGNENFIAVELIDNVIVMAIESCKQNKLNNVRFMNLGAEYLPKFIKDCSIQNIYLNFSPPFPQKSFENRRLTNDRNVGNYKSFLVDGGCVYQKTDDKDFFDYSFNQFVKFGFKVSDISFQINSGELPNIETEYEKKFRAENLPIYALKAEK